MRRLALLLAAIALPACAPAGAPSREPLERVLPPIYDAADGSALGEAALLEALAGARFVVLGESHDNALHHRLQARVLAGLSAAGRRPAVVFEMLRVEQQPELEALQTGGTPSLPAIRAATAWDESGWPDWALYEPVFAAAVAAGMPLAGGDLGRAELAWLRGPEAEAEAARLGVATPLPPDVEAGLARDLVAAHCGWADDAMLESMIRIQRARDARLAGALLAAGGEEGSAVLIAGAEHGRVDRGVPRAFRHLAPGEDLLSLAFLEVPRDSADPWAELEARYGGPPPFDYVWVTDPAPRDDPCG